MDKIYSRKRIRIPKINMSSGNSNNKKRKKLLKILVILIIACITANYIIQSITPIFERLCETEAKSIATMISNEKATEVMKSYEYKDLVTIMKDNNGNITAVKTNVIPVNEIISDVAIKIQDEINKNSKNNISIRLGSFTGSKLLSGRGPKVNIRISAVGNVETDFRSEFKEAGINQTLHRIYLDVKCKVAILTPFNTIEREITNQVVLVENVIVGTIPSTYYNLEGLNKSDALEIVE